MHLDESIDPADAWLKLVRKHRRKLKGLPRVGFNPNGGNVEHNIEMFNKMNNPTDTLSNNPVSGPFGGEVSAPVANSSMGENLENISDKAIIESFSTNPKAKYFLDEN